VRVLLTVFIVYSVLLSYEYSSHRASGRNSTAALRLAKYAARRLSSSASRRFDPSRRILIRFPLTALTRRDASSPSSLPLRFSDARVFSEPFRDFDDSL